MNIFLFILINIVFLHRATQEKHTTRPIQDRIQSLKWQLEEEMNQKLSPVEDDFSEKYVDMGSRPITPIMNNDRRIKHDMFKLPEIKTTTEREINVVHKKPLRAKKRPLSKKVRIHKPDVSEVFYRRQQIFGLELKNERMGWEHCQDLITPYVKGHKKEYMEQKRMNSTHPTVLRLIQLLSVNTSAYSREDIYSILYQINNIQIRLFQWDMTSIRILLRVLGRDKNQTRAYTFRDIKYGMKALFHKWHLDIANTSYLLKQARIFRPPCLRASRYEGSTKKVKASLYPKGIKHTTKRCGAKMCPQT